MDWFPRWLKTARSPSAVGIYLAQNTIVALDEHQQTTPHHYKVDQGAAMSSALRQLIEQQGWQHRQLYIALGRNWYQHTQLEKPNIPNEELAQALPWTMRDLVNEPIDTLLFDYIDLPPGPAGQPRMAVYSSNKAQLAELVDAITPVCDIATIGVDELAMANLLAPEQRGLLLHKVPGQELTLTFIHQRQWHFSRAIRGFQALDDEHTPLDQFVFDNLLLELQRSIDYAVGQLKLNEPDHWYLALPQRVTPAVQEAIQLVFNITPVSLTTDTLTPESLPALAILDDKVV